MKNAPRLKEELLPSLRDTLLPWAREGQIKILFARPPFPDVEGVTVVRGRPPLLKKPQLRFSNPRVFDWLGAGVNAIDGIYMGCVLEGEADLRIGVTERMAARDETLRDGPGFYVLQIPARVLFLVPPGVPYSNGFTPHWERPDLAQASSQILWINVRPQGVFIHTCRTRGEEHWNSGGVFVSDPRLMLLAEMLLEELGANLSHSGAICQSLLLTMLGCMTQGFNAGSGVARIEESAHEKASGAGKGVGAHPLATTDVVQRACRYIRTYSHLPLRLEQLAAQSFVSAAHLNRLFQAELGTSVMSYALRCRIEAAQSLLLDTNLSAREISQVVGFSHASHLSQVFTRHVGVAPMEFRRRRGQKELST